MFLYGYQNLNVIIDAMSYGDVNSEHDIFTEKRPLLQRA